MREKVGSTQKPLCYLLYSPINFPVKKKEKVTPYSFFLSFFLLLFNSFLYFSPREGHLPRLLSLSLSHTELSSRAYESDKTLIILCGALFQCPKKPDPRHSLTASNVVNVTLTSHMSFSPFSSFI